MLKTLYALPHSIRTFRQGQYLFHQGDLIETMFLVELGEARLVRRHRDGNVVVLQRALAGIFLAEASLFAKHYHCDAIATTRTNVRLISRALMKELFENDKSFAVSWTVYLADEIRGARLRAEILSLKTVSERLDAWIADRGHFPVKGSWKTVAQEVGTSNEALYREMALRRTR